MELGYGEEIVVNHGSNLLYDVDETENLSLKLSVLGMFYNTLCLQAWANFELRHQGRQFPDHH